MHSEKNVRPKPIPKKQHGQISMKAGQATTQSFEMQYRLAGQDHFTLEIFF